MKNISSLIVCIVISITLVQYRVSYSDMKPGNPPLKVTFWDACGYYLYLPAICKYHDYKELKWLTDVDKKYSVTGGNGWQAEKLKNGNCVFKYLGGVALMELPFYYIGDLVAKHSHYPPDGFSPPYQYALGFGILVYCIIAILLLRKILLLYFNDTVVSITLLMLCLATNFIQYACIDNGQSHAYIFLLYALVLYSTLKWHKQPTATWAILTGYVIGLATICRPTEAIMLFIPLLWNTHNKIAAKEKWQLVKQHKSHIMYAGIAGIVGILPQLIYWKMATGDLMYDVGSKWEFLSPHFRVLFGWEKGWFVYTPITILFVAGLFFIKQFPFRKSAIWFCLLNVYIIIAWHEWRYGGSYSTRALVQSYPVFALPFAAVVDKINMKKWRVFFYALCAYLLAVNLFQLYQYNTTILLYDGMNKAYYKRIYLNPNPSPIDMSAIDSNEIISNEAAYHKTVLINRDSILTILGGATYPLTEIKLQDHNGAGANSWLKVECSIKAPGYLWQSYLNATLQQGDSTKQSRVRLFNPISKDDSINDYAFYVRVPQYFERASVKVNVSSAMDFKGVVYKLKVTEFEK